MKKKAVAKKATVAKHHPDHAQELRRLNRIVGQLEGVGRMIEERRYCCDILQQTRAVTSAIRGLEAAILSTHLRHCFTAAIETKSEEARAKVIEEFVDLYEQRR